MRIILAVVVVASACTNPPPAGGGGGGGSATGGGAGGGGTGGGGTAPHWTYYELDPTAAALDGHALAIDPTDQRIGVAYFADTDGGSEREVRYVDWRNGTVSPPESWRTVHKLFGISLAYQPTGEPAVAYLGGGSDTSLAWTESDVEVAYRSNGNWTKSVPFTMSGQIAMAPCNTNVDTTGFVVGLWPALAIVPVTGRTYLAFRDVHNGANIQGDWGGSDLKLAEGVYPNWSGTCIAPADTGTKAGVGNHNAIAVGAGDQPVIAFDLDNDGALAGDVYLTTRQPGGTWSAPIYVFGTSNAGSGPAVAWDADGGYGVAVGDKTTNIVSYRHSKDLTFWDSTEMVYGSGSGGWNASLAFDPNFGEPAVAFYTCSDAANQAEGHCPNAQLLLTQKVAGVWSHPLKIDDVGAAAAQSVVPRLAFLSSGKRVVVYPVPPSGHLRLAIEN